MKTANNNVYADAYFHFIWSTKDRFAMIHQNIEADLYRYMASKCRDLGVIVYGIGGMPDHVHIACTLPTTLSAADFMHRIKGASSHFVSHELNSSARFAWQPGYGYITFGRSQLPIIRNYVRNQKAHHARWTTTVDLELPSAVFTRV